MEEQTLEQSIAQLIVKVPAPVRTFILNDLSKMTGEIMQRYQLHVDTAGTLESELLLMLLGQSTPAEFVFALENSGLSNEIVSSIVADINRDVFVRIREAERSHKMPLQVMPTQSGSPPAQPRSPVPIYSPLPTPAPSTPLISFTSQPPKQVPPPTNLPGQLPEPPAPRPTPPPPHIELPAPPPVPVLPSTPSTEAPNSNSQTRVLHTMAKDMQALKSGMDPYRVAHPAPPAWAAAPVTASQTSPVPNPLPSKQVPMTAPSVQTEAVSIQPNPTPTLPPQQPLTVHLKQYGVDPYREPVE